MVVFGLLWWLLLWVMTLLGLPLAVGILLILVGLLFLGVGTVVPFS